MGPVIGRPRPRTVGVLSTQDEDVRSLRELITYGLKGLAAYTKHANALLRSDDGGGCVPGACSGRHAG